MPQRQGDHTHPQLGSLRASGKVQYQNHRAVVRRLGRTCLHPLSEKSPPARMWSRSCHQPPPAFSGIAIGIGGGGGGRVSPPSAVISPSEAVRVRRWAERGGDAPPGALAQQFDHSAPPPASCLRASEELPPSQRCDQECAAHGRDEPPRLACQRGLHHSLVFEPGGLGKQPNTLLMLPLLLELFVRHLTTLLQAATDVGAPLTGSSWGRRVGHRVRNLALWVYLGTSCLRHEDQTSTCPNNTIQESPGEGGWVRASERIRGNGRGFVASCPGAIPWFARSAGDGPIFFALGRR